MSKIRILLGASILLLSVQVNAAVITLDAIDSGHYSDKGEHFDGNPNYAVGFESSIATDRNFFVFDLASINGIITSASLLLDTGAVRGSDEYSLYGVSTDIDVLTSGHARNDLVGLGVYQDIGTGLNYGSTTITDDDIFSLIDIPLNLAAVVSLNLSLNFTDGLFAIGGTYPDNTQNFAFFSTGGGSQTKQLVMNVISPVPVPATVWLFGTGLLGLIGFSKRRKAA